jgi:long-chain fatty acid transport protein
MKKLLMTTAAVLAGTGALQAGGIDRSGQGLGPLFETGRYFELSFGLIQPAVDGTDLLGGPTGNVGQDYTQLSLGYKYDINDKLSFALVLDQPFGADVVYAATSPLLGGTSAQAEAVALTGILRYKFDGGFSVHGGVRAQRASGDITLAGLAYGGLNGYNVALGEDTAPGYLVGVAYERPDIALRIALTYNSAIKHEFATAETLGGSPIGPPSVTEVKTPQSVNLDFQTGIAANTLLFGQVRWADWSNFLIDPVVFTGLAGGGLISLDDSFTYTLGVGRRFNDNWSGSISLSYEEKGDPLVSPLAPTNGRIGLTVGGVYTKDSMKVTMGVNYTKLGDAQPETGTPDTARANMTDNDSLGIGVKVGWSF